MAGNKKISQLVDGGSGQSGDNFVIERGGVNFKVDNASVSGNPGGLDLLGIVNDMIVKDEKGEVALEQRQTLPSPISFVDNTAVPPTEVDTDIYLLDDTGASNAAWDGNPANTWVRFDGISGTWKGIAPVDGLITTLQDTGFVRYFDPTTSAWELLGVATPAGLNTEIQFNNAGVFGANAGLTLNTAFNEFKCDFSAVFNESGLDRDFRIEGLSDANLFFTDASADKVGIGTATPSAKLTVTTSALQGFLVQGSSGVGLALGEFFNSGAVGEALKVTGGTSAVNTALSVVGNGAGAILATCNKAGVDSILGTNSNGGQGVTGGVTSGVGDGVQGFIQGAGSNCFNARLLAAGVGLNIICQVNGVAASQSIVSTFERASQSSNGTADMNVFKRVARNGFGYTGDFFRIEENFGAGSVSGDNTGNLFHVLKDGNTKFVINSVGTPVFESFTVATVPAVVVGGFIYVSDETGGATMAFSDGVNWRRVQDRAVVA